MWYSWKALWPIGAPTISITGWRIPKLASPFIVHRCPRDQDDFTRKVRSIFNRRNIR